ncbi:MAG: hypothetical protein ACRELC_04170 [Gemmatimonadota bacterium]
MKPSRWPTLAAQVPASATHRARLWAPIFGRVEWSCDRCRWSGLGKDRAAAAAGAALHSQRVVVVDERGAELADSAELQREARARWDAAWDDPNGGLQTVTELIRARLGDHEEEVIDVDQDQDQELGMSDRIRAAREGVRSGGPARRRRVAERIFGPPPEGDGDTGEGTTDKAGDAGRQEE